MGDEQHQSGTDLNAEPQVNQPDQDVSEHDLQSLDTNNSCSVEPQKTKIDILLKATGNAPIMKKKKWVVEPDKKIASLIEFVKKYLKLEPSESLYLYVNQAFAPSPDQTVRNVFECFGTDGKLILHYCKSQAWG